MDFQPLEQSPIYDQKYISPLQNIRKKYPDLHESISTKFYDNISIFSNQILIGRFKNESNTNDIIFPAHQDCLHAYINLASVARPNNDILFKQYVEKNQRYYDEYNSSKDPAIKFFEKYFGKEWSKSFVHDFLFDLSGVGDNTFLSSSID